MKEFKPLLYCDDPSPKIPYSKFFEVMSRNREPIRKPKIICSLNPKGSWLEKLVDGKTSK